jgi:D-galactonate transporter
MRRRRNLNCESFGLLSLTSIKSSLPWSAVRHNSGASSAEDALSRKVTWRLIPFLMLCYIVAYLDRVNVGFAKLQMTADLGFSDTVYGLGAGVFFMGYLAFGVPSNLILHRVGARRWIAAIMITWGLISGLTAFVKSPFEFSVLRFFLGVAEAGFYPGVILYLTYWFPDQRRARVLSLFQSAIPLSGIFGGPLSGWILDRLGNSHSIHGWQWLILIEALPALLTGIAALAFLENTVADADWLTPTERQLLLAEKAKDRESTDVSSRSPFTDFRVWILGLLVFGLAMGLYGISFWMPTLLKEQGTLSSTQVGWASAVPNLFAIVGMFLIARSSDFRDERRWHVVFAALLGATGLVLSVIFSHHLFLSLASLSLAAVGVMSALPLQWFFATSFLSGSSMAAAIGLINSVGNLAGFVSPLLIGWLRDRTHSMDQGMYVLACFALMSAILAGVLPSGMVKR